MDPVQATIAQIVQGLRPAGLWYGALSTVVVLTTWSLQDQPFSAWPTPLRCGAWAWLIATASAVPYTHLVAFAATWQARAKSQPHPPKPRVPKTSPPSPDPRLTSNGVVEPAQAVEAAPTLMEAVGELTEKKSPAE